MNPVRHLSWRSRSVQIGVVALAAALVIGFAVRRKSAPGYFTAIVARGTVASAVDATGTVNARTTVQVGSQVSGSIARILVDFNSHVQRGQLIAEIDPTVYNGQLLQAQADLENAHAILASGQAGVNAAQQSILGAKANTEKAQAALQQSQLDLKRNTPLYEQGIISAQQFDQAKATYSGDLAAYHAAEAATQQAQAGLKSAQAQRLQAQATVKQKTAALSVAQTNLAHCRILSPIDGTVINRAVDVGQTVAASFQTPTLFTIAQDLNQMQVYVATDESDVGRIHVGDDANFTVDAFPHETFHGSVTQVRMNPTTVQNVVQYNTVISFDNPGGKLFPGMTAYVHIPVETARNVLVLPNAALRFKPDLPAEELTARLRQAGIAANGQRHAAPARPAAPSMAANGSEKAARQAVTQHPEIATVWLLGANQQLAPVQVRTGITDFSNTAVVQVLKGNLAVGARVVTGAVVARTAANASSPLGMGRGPRVR